MVAEGGSAAIEMASTTGERALKVKQPRVKPIKKTVKVRKAKQIEKALARADQLMSRIQTKETRQEKKTKLNTIY